MQSANLLPHLFRTEFGRIVATLCKQFGMEHIGIAEDIAADTFLAAAESWSYNGLPPNPAAWLYAVAKNKAKNYYKRDNLFNKKILRQLIKDPVATENTEIDLSENNITDSQLKMLFAVCHPSIPEESKIALSLRILCGFGITEIADALLMNPDAVSKRLTRAKEKLREEKITMEFPGGKAISNRLQTVLATIYLLFNEGYFSESKDGVLRKDLCLEAMRLAYLLLDNSQTNLPDVNALLALMCFHASRFDARKNDNGEMVLYEDQDQSLWDEALVNKGVYYFKQSATGNKLSKYHLEAGIAYWYTVKDNTGEKWEHILQLYNQLLQLEYSPLAALNRTYALSKVHGNKIAIAEAEKLQLNTNHYYFTLLGVLYKDLDTEKAKGLFEKAYQIAKTNTDKMAVRAKIDSL